MWMSASTLSIRATRELTAGTPTAASDVPVLLASLGMVSSAQVSEAKWQTTE